MSETEALIKATEKLGEMEAIITTNQEKIGKLQEENRGMAEKMEERKKISDEYVKDYAKVQDLKSLHEEFDKLDARFSKQKADFKDAGIEPTEHRKAVADMIGNNFDESKCKPETREFLNSPEYRLLNETTGSEGGLLVSPEIEERIIKNVTQFDQMRSISRVRTIGTDTFQQPRETSGVTSTWVDEESAGTDSTPAIGMWTIRVNNLVTKMSATRAWLMDTFANADAEMADSVGRSQGQTEGAAFVTGNGVAKPLGFLTGHGTDANLYPADVSGKGTAVLDPADFSELAKFLKREYWDTSTYVMNQVTLADTMQLTQDSKFIWQPGLQGGFPATILGRPFAIMPTMENQSDGSYPVAYGDFNQAYTIVDRIGMIVVKDEASNFPKIISNYLRRVGGRVTLPEGIKVLEVT